MLPFRGIKLGRIAPGDWNFSLRNIRPYAAQHVASFSTTPASRRSGRDQPWTEEQDELLARRRREGVTWKAITEELGINVHPMTVANRFALHLAQPDERRRKVRRQATYRHWTAEETEVLQKLKEEGKPPEQCALQLGRSLRAVELQWERSRHRAISRARFFTAEDDRRILELKAAGHRYADIARLMQRAHSSISHRHRLYLLAAHGGRTVNTKPTDWTPEKTKELLVLREKGVPWSEISNLLNQSIGSCKGRFYNIQRSQHEP